MISKSSLESRNRGTCPFYHLFLDSWIESTSACLSVLLDEMRHTWPLNHCHFLYLLCCGMDVLKERSCRYLAGMLNSYPSPLTAEGGSPPTSSFVPVGFVITESNFEVGIFG